MHASCKWFVRKQHELSLIIIRVQMETGPLFSHSELHFDNWQTSLMLTLSIPFHGWHDMTRWWFNRKIQREGLPMFYYFDFIKLKFIYQMFYSVKQWKKNSKHLLKRHAKCKHWRRMEKKHLSFSAMRNANEKLFQQFDNRVRDFALIWILRLVVVFVRCWFIDFRCKHRSCYNLLGSQKV